jgi:AAA15 family ATPase/GTPase
MKIQSLHLKYFKKFRDQELNFTDEETGLARDFIVLVGMNGAGKTSILQAIAATLGVATGRFEQLSQLEWSGFTYELLSNSWGRFEPDVTLKVQFSSSELNAVNNFYQKLREMRPDYVTEPDKRNIVTLQWKNERPQYISLSLFFAWVIAVILLIHV